jgi:membrane protein implicated in regulation of membrane protease activity
MNKNRIIFYFIFAVFHVGAFIFTLIIQDVGYLMKIYEYIWLFKFVTFFGIVLIAVDVAWSWIVNRDSKKEKAALTHELNTLKAKLFDLQEKAKESEALKNMPKAK